MKNVVENSETETNSGAHPIIRMGREVPSKRAATCDHGRDTKCVEKKEKDKAERDGENKASSLV